MWTKCHILSVNVNTFHRRQAECAKTARIQMALPPGGKPAPAGAPTANLYEELGDSSMWVKLVPLVSSHKHSTITYDQQIMYPALRVLYAKLDTSNSKRINALFKNDNWQLWPQKCPCCFRRISSCMNGCLCLLSSSLWAKPHCLQQYSWRLHFSLCMCF